MNNSFLCSTCGTQYPPNTELSRLCVICNDDRQYIGEGGQAWTNMGELKSKSCIAIKPVRENLYSFKVQPDFALANRALLVKSNSGNVLWDCIPLFDQATTDFINSIGGVQAIGISHPHYYTAMNIWSEVFTCPIYLHTNDREWVCYKGKNIHYWTGNQMELWDGIQIRHTGGHFPGSCVLELPLLSPGGILLSGDSLYISRSKKHVSVMYSYPNQILLHRDDFALFYKKSRILKFDTLYGAFDNQDLEGNAMEIYLQSMTRYVTSYGISD